MFFLGLLALGCLVLAIRQFTVVYPIERSNQLRRSLKIAGLISIMSFIVILIIGVFIWAETGVFESMILAYPALCLVPFVFAITTLGTYVQFFWYARLSKYRDDLIQGQIERLESHDQEPPSK
jgi:Na+/H+ antiporter NhaC